MNALKFTAIYVLTILIPFWFVNKGFFYFFLVTGLVLCFFEYASYLGYGKTLSQRFWDESRRNKILGIVALSVFYIYLIIHLIFQI
jgi:hypothetical protein